MKVSKIIDKIKHEIDVLKGEETKDRTYASEQTYPTEPQAVDAFLPAVKRLFDVNAWSELPGLNSHFQLTDQNGQPKTGAEPQVGDYICINIPGPTNENWVQIIDRRQTDTLVEFTVKPSPHPRDPAQTEVKHFFGEDARSTFRVERQGNRIRAFEIGQNESINNQGAEAGDRPVVNTLIAEGGWMFFQKMQWQKLTDYLVGL